MSAKAIMVCAALSTTSRAGLNIIDRHQVGRQALPVVAVSLLNNAFPAVAMVLAATCLGAGGRLLACVADARTALFGGLVQLTAFVFTQAFRHSTVNQVTAATKAADLLIPVAIFVATGRWAWANYAFAVATTLVCIPMLLSSDANQAGFRGSRSAVAIIAALTLQAGLTPLLARSTRQDASALDIFVFTAATIVWRLAWSALPLFRRQGLRGSDILAIAVRPLSMLRAALAVITQLTFVIAAGSASSAVAWPILNSTGILSMVFAALVIGEKPSRTEVAIILAITVLSLARFLSLPA